jgi:hypothetical protein
MAGADCPMSRVEELSTSKATKDASFITTSDGLACLAPFINPYAQSAGRLHQALEILFGPIRREALTPLLQRVE